MKLNYGVALAFILCAHTCFSQDTKQADYFNITEAGILLNVSANYAGEAERNAPNAGSLRVINGLFLSPQWSIGVGLGLDGYSRQHEEGIFKREYYNTMPVFLDSRYYFRDQRNTPFIFTDIGYVLKMSDKFEKGLLFGIGGGYKFFPGKKICLIAGLGYNLQQIRDISFAKSEKLNLHSASVQAGFLF